MPLQKPKTILIVVLTVAILAFQISQARAEIDLGNWDEYLADQLTISDFAGGILASIFFSVLFLFPILIYDRGKHPVMLSIIGLCLLGFCVGVGWFPVWLLTILVFIIAITLGAKLKGLIS